MNQALVALHVTKPSKAQSDAFYANLPFLSFSAMMTSVTLRSSIEGTLSVSVSLSVCVSLSISLYLSINLHNE